MVKDRQLAADIFSSHSSLDLFTKPDKLTTGLAGVFYTWAFYKKHPISSVSFIHFTNMLF